MSRRGKPEQENKKNRFVKPLQQGVKIEKILNLDCKLVHIVIKVSAIVGETIFWTVTSKDEIFTEFKIITDGHNLIKLYETSDQKILTRRDDRPRGLLSEAITLIVNELRIHNPESKPTYFLKAVNHYLYTEFHDAGFEKNRNLHATTLEYSNW